MKEKEYEIKTVQDMIDCTNEHNIKNFLTDLEAILISAHALRVLSDEADGKIESKGFLWIDDGKHYIKNIIAHK